MKVLVTGSSGFIGSHLCERLKADGHDVWECDIRNHPRQDVRLGGIVEDAVVVFKPDVVIHLAARTGVRDSLQWPHEYVKTNVEGTNNVLDVARFHGVKHVVFASSSSVYGDAKAALHDKYRLQPNPIPEWFSLSPLSPYAATKVAGEALCQAYTSSHGLPTTCLRFFTVYGPRCRTDMAVGAFLKSMLSGTPLTLYGDGAQSRDFTYVSDIVDGIVKAMETPKGFRVYNLGAGQPVSIRKLIDKLGVILGHGPAIIDHQPAQKCDVPYTHADTAFAREELGWEPKVGIDEGLRRTADWFKENIGE